MEPPVAGAAAVCVEPPEAAAVCVEAPEAAAACMEPPADPAAGEAQEPAEAQALVDPAAWAGICVSQALPGA